MKKSKARVSFADAVGRGPMSNAPPLSLSFSLSSISLQFHFYLMSTRSGRPAPETAETASSSSARAASTSTNAALLLLAPPELQTLVAASRAAAATASAAETVAAAGGGAPPFLAVARGSIGRSRARRRGERERVKKESTKKTVFRQEKQKQKSALSLLLPLLVRCPRRNKSRRGPPDPMRSRPHRCLDRGPRSGQR